MALFDTVLPRNVPAKLLSRVSLYSRLGTTALSPVGFALAGPAAHLAGNKAVLLFGAGFSVLSPRTLFAVGDIRRRPWRDA